MNIQNPFPVHLMVMDETDSTNNQLHSLCEKEQLKEFTTLAARFQTAGRGQRGNTWEAEKDKNLLFSFVLFPNFLEANNQFYLSQIISLAIVEVLNKYTSFLSIKWPNDIYWKDKKIAGILIENDLIGRYISRSIIGIGLNVNQQTFKTQAPNPISLWQILKRDLDCFLLLSEIMKCCQQYYLQLQREEIKEITMRYMKVLFRRDTWHYYRDANGIFKGKICHVESNGRLVIEDEKGKLRYFLFKEVEYVL